MSNVPLPLHVPDPLFERWWDWLIQGMANAVSRRGRRDGLARRLEQLRVHPNLRRLVREAVVGGWQYWLTHNHHPTLVAAIKQRVAAHVPTLVQEQLPRALEHPIEREDLERAFADWFHDLGVGLTRGQYRQAAHELVDTIMQIALASQELRPFVEAIMHWEATHQRHQPRVGERFIKARQLALERAQAADCAQIASAHLLAGLLALPPMQPQQALAQVGLTLARVENELPHLHFRRSPGVVPAEAEGAQVMVQEAKVIAWEEGAEEVSDLHLLRAAIVLASDQQCRAGESLRRLFRRLGLAPDWIGAQLALAHPLQSLEPDPGWLLSTQGL
jgi:hypothetical protein